MNRFSSILNRAFSTSVSEESSPPKSNSLLKLRTLFSKDQAIYDIEVKPQEIEIPSVEGFVTHISNHFQVLDDPEIEHHVKKIDIEDLDNFDENTDDNLIEKYELEEDKIKPGTLYRVFVSI